MVEYFLVVKIIAIAVIIYIVSAGVNYIKAILDELRCIHKEFAK